MKKKKYLNIQQKESNKYEFVFIASLQRLTHFNQLIGNYQTWKTQTS